MAFRSVREHRQLLASLLTLILVAATFVVVYGGHFKTIDLVASEEENSNPRLEAGEESSSTRGPQIDKLRFQVIKGETPPQPPQYPETPDEVLNVDGFTGDYSGSGWSEYGTAPYLDAVGDGNYIETPDYCSVIGFFTFEDTTLDQIGKVKLEAYSQSEWSEIDGDVYFFTSEAEWYLVGSIEAGTDWGWYFTEYGNSLISILHDVATVNSAKFAIHYSTPDSSSGPSIRVDAARLALWEPRASTPPYVPRLEAMENHAIDALSDILNPSHIETLVRDHFTLTSTPGFHIAHVGFNLMRPYLSDVNLRHALFHAYNQEAIVASIYRYSVTPIRSLVPPGQGQWVNPSVPTHPFNPGNAGDAPGTQSTFGIMKGAGYTYVGTGYGDLAAHWEKNGVPLPTWHFWTPTYGVEATAAEHCERIAEEWHKCGFNNIAYEPSDFNTYTSNVFYDHNFDIYMMSWELDRLPTQLYYMCHSSTYVPGSRHAVGLNDPVLDSLVETATHSLDHNAAVTAAWDAQTRLYDPQYAQALPYMNLYSAVYFDAFNLGLRGIVSSPGYGSDNMWTLLNMHWESGHPFERIESGKSTVIWCIDEEPSSLNYLATVTEYEESIIKPTMDKGLQVNPYSHADVVWQYSEYPTVAGPITEVTPHGVNIVNGMSVTFHIRDNIYWQDGNKFDADDAIFSLNFLRNNQIPQYLMTWKDIADIYKVDQLTFKVWANNTSPSYVYNWDKGAFACPPQVWAGLDGKSLATILSYDLENNATDTGPWSYPLTPNGPKTLIFGTGPYVFDSYDAMSMRADLHGWDVNGINLGYFKTVEEIDNVKAEMFWTCGDVNRDGVVDQIDDDIYDANYGMTVPPGNPDADLNEDGIIDWEDGAIIGAYMGKRREYPEETIDVAVLDVTAFPRVVHPGQKINITVIAKNKGNAGFTTNFTYYYDDIFIVNQTVTNLIPYQNTTLYYLWDTSGVSPGVYTLSVNATVLDGVDADLIDNAFTNGIVKIGKTKIAVSPETSIVGSAGRDFSINITIADAPYNTTWAWEFKLSWNTTLLNITDIREGTFLSHNGQWTTAFMNVTNYTAGWVLASCTLIDDPIEHGQPLPDDNATLATIDFTVLEVGNCTLHLSDTILLDYGIDSYYHTTQDGKFEVLLGDVNRDGIIDEQDFGILELAYGSRPGDPNWNPEADIWGPEDKPDGYINVYDLAMLGKKYGETP